MQLSALIMLLGAISSVSAWQISGKVTDIRGKALPQAQVCVKGSTTGCITTGVNGTFSITGTAVGLLPKEAAQSSSLTFDLVMRSGKLFLDAPANGLTRLEWFNAAGRCLASEDKIALTKGMNRLDMAPSFSGVLFLRLSFGNVQLTWKMAEGGVGNRVSPVAVRKNDGKALFKEAASISMPVITATLSGYKSRNYYATDATLDTLAWILLATTEDDTTYKFGGTSYPLSAVPPNQINGPAPYACAISYSGKKVGDLRMSSGHYATINNVFAPKDSTFLIAIGFQCANDHGYSSCASKPGSKAKACRPVQFKINDQTLPDTLMTECYSGGDWCFDLYDSIPLPLKAGLNSIQLFSNVSDMPNFDRIIVKDGRAY